MKNKLLNTSKTKNSKLRRGIYIIISLAFMFFLWWLISATVFKERQILPSPIIVFGLFFKSFALKEFWGVIVNTLVKSLVSFTLGFVIGIILSIFAKLSYRVRSLIEPIITVLRAMPTLGVTFILFMFFSGGTVSIIIGLLISMPLVYTNILSALTNVDKNLIEMAQIYKISKPRQIVGIYIPSITPYIFSSIVAGIGLNLKITIAAEIVSVATRTTIGGFLMSARIASDYPAMFLWVLVAIVITFALESLVKFIMRLCIPSKYKTRKNISSFFKKLSTKIKTVNNKNKTKKVEVSSSNEDGGLKK